MIVRGNDFRFSVGERSIGAGEEGYGEAGFWLSCKTSAQVG